MTIASQAMIEYRLVTIKKKIEDMVMQAAKDGKRYFETPDLWCHPEEVPTLLAWMKKEGLKVEHRKWMAKANNWGCYDDDTEVEHSKYIISF